MGDIIVNKNVDIKVHFGASFLSDKRATQAQEIISSMASTALLSANTAPRRRVSAEEVVSQVLALIDAREFQPGDRLREQELADRFNVSRGPIREALRILEAKSIVRIEPMRGATITRLSDQEARDAVEISAALFALGARRACQHASSGDVAALRQTFAVLETMLDEKVPPKEFFYQTLRIGRQIMAIAGSDRLRRLVEEVRFGAPTYYGPLGFASPSLRREAFASWSTMIDAIEGQDADLADRMARKVHDDAMTAALHAIS
jgi:DNA-binding GntR family transcriptional regulator